MGDIGANGVVGMGLSQRLLLYMVGIALVAAGAVALVADWAIDRSLGPAERARQVEVVARLADVLDDEVGVVHRDVLVALRAGPNRQLAEAAFEGRPPPSDARAQVERVFQALLVSKPSYLQARLIAARDGREQVRVERSASAGAVRVLADAELQDKSQRPYVKAALELSSGEVHVSPIELNQEHGRVQEPWVPVLRAATPVVSDRGVTLGVVVINVDVTRALSLLARAGDGHGGRTFLVDARGRYLAHPDASQAFAHEFGRTGSLLHDYPGLRALLDAERPRAQDAELHGSPSIAAVAPVQLAGGPRVRVVSITPSPGGQALRDAREPALAAAALVGLLSALAAFWAARSLVRPLRAMTAAAAQFPTAEPPPLPAEEPGEVGVLARALGRMNRNVLERNEALARQERRFRAVVEGSAHAMVVVGPQGQIDLVNRRTEDLFGYTRDQLVGQPIELLVPEASRYAHGGRVAEYRRDPEVRMMMRGRDVTGRHRDGHEVPLEISLAPMEDSAGAATLASIVDITDRKRQELELRRSNAELEQFAYVASHDLQEPLRMVASYSELLLERYAGRLDERADKYLRYAADGARRMQALVADLLAYSRVESQGAPLVPVDVGQVLEAVLRSLGPSLREAQASVSAGPMPVIMGDETQLRQLLQNLISNSLKFRSEDKPVLRIEAQREGEHWRIAVSDNGIGIEPCHVERVFQMFQRLGRAREVVGSGIGLAMARRIVERHGGRIWVESEPGHGATFFFTAGAAEEHPS